MRRWRREKEVEVEEEVEVEVEAEREVEKEKAHKGEERGGGGEERRRRKREAREGNIVKSSKIVVSVEINFQTIKIIVPNKQLVYDQKWDIQA